MRLITFKRADKTGLGAWINGDRQVLDLEAAARSEGVSSSAFGSMLGLIEAGPGAWDQARKLVQRAPKEAVFDTAACKVLAPLPRPTQIRDCLCFPDHLVGATRARFERMIAAAPDPEKMRAELMASGGLEVPKSYYDFPLYYISNRMTISGPDDDVTWPAYSRHIDYELEWAAVIGKECARADKAAAKDAIFGFTIFNDWSARDEQMRAMSEGALPLGPGRGKDFCNGVGPCIVTADEFDDPYNLAMIARVNGKEASRGSTSGMHYKFEDLIVFLSAGGPLYPGELICSGTVGGGCSIETGMTIAPNDVIELEIERIGTLRNRVLAPHMSGA